MIVPLLAAAAAAAQPLPPEAEADMRCMAALLYAVGISADKKDKEGADAMSNAAIYYVGRLDARLPGLDYRAQFKRLVYDPEFGKIINSEIKRCAMESANALQRLGTSAQQADK